LLVGWRGIRMGEMNPFNGFLCFRHANPLRWISYFVGWVGRAWHHAF